MQGIKINNVEKGKIQNVNWNQWIKLNAVVKFKKKKKNRNKTKEINEMKLSTEKATFFKSIKVTLNKRNAEWNKRKMLFKKKNWYRKWNWELIIENRVKWFVSKQSLRFNNFYVVIVF